MLLRYKSRPFGTLIRPLARLLDWLSWKYKLVFVVSAGNYESLELPEGVAQRIAVGMSVEDLQLIVFAQLERRGQPHISLSLDETRVIKLADELVDLVEVGDGGIDRLPWIRLAPDPAIKWTTSHSLREFVVGAEKTCCHGSAG